MKNSLTSLFLLAVSLLSLPGAAQTDDLDRAQADYFYRHFAFSAAIPVYESLADKTLTDYTRLADCYRLTGQAVKAAICYSKAAADTVEFSAEAALHYGQALMTLERYRHAERWLRFCVRRTPADRRAQNLLSGCQTAKSRKLDMPVGYATYLSDFNTDKNEFAPAIWKNRLVFTSDSAYEIKKKNDAWTGSSFFNIYSASFDSNRHIYGGEVAAVSRRRKGNIRYHDGPCTFAGDLDEMYFTRTRCNRLTGNSKENKDTVALLNIMVASHYDTLKRTFRKIKPFAYNSKNHSTAHPAISPDGRLLVFASNKKGGAGGYDLYMCKRQADGKWLPPENMGNLINTEGDELFPFLADNNTLYFSSDGQRDCFGGLDVYKSAFNEASWSLPENMGMPVNSSYDDISLAMHDDGSNSFFSSNRPAKNKGDNIYFFQSKQLFLLIDVTDAVTGLPLPGATIVLSAIDTLKAKSDSRGQCRGRLSPKFPYDYKLSVALPGYDTLRVDAAFQGSARLRDTIHIPVAMEERGRAAINRILAQVAKSDPSYTPHTALNGPGRDQRIFFNLKVTDCRTRRPVNDTAVKVNVTFDTSVKRISYYLDHEVQDGELTRELYPGKKYMLEVSSFDYKALYITRINTEFLLKHHADTVIFDSVCLDAREDVIDLGLIPFGYDSATLNAIAESRLSKFVSYLNELHPTMQLLIRGHTDCRESTPGYNKVLSERRANAVRNYLVKKGVAPGRLHAVGVKDDMPRVRCNNCEPDGSPEKIIKHKFEYGRTDCSVNEHAENRYIDCVILAY